MCVGFSAYEHSIGVFKHLFKPVHMRPDVSQEAQAKEGAALNSIAPSFGEVSARYIQPHDDTPAGRGANATNETHAWKGPRACYCMMTDAPGVTGRLKYRCFKHDDGSLHSCKKTEDCGGLCCGPDQGGYKFQSMTCEAENGTTLREANEKVYNVTNCLGENSLAAPGMEFNTTHGNATAGAPMH